MRLANRKAAKKRDPASDCAPSPAASAHALLAWYDRHRRTLPWRAEKGAAPDPYRVWLSEIMLQQTTVKAVAPYYMRFLARWPTIADLAAESLVEVLKLWAGLGYYARARNLHACARAIVEQHGGSFPQTEAELLTLPGIGAYTAAAIAAIAFGRKAAPVDGNVERVIARLYAIEEPLPKGKPQIRTLASALVPHARPGDFAQAMMDLGATLCTPKKPACALCPWNEPCVANKRGDPERFPRKAPKAEGKLRRGAAFVVTRADGALLVRTRPDKGLLAKMTEVPTTQWSHDFDERDAFGEAPFPTSPPPLLSYPPPCGEGRSTERAKRSEGDRGGGGCNRIAARPELETATPTPPASLRSAGDPPHKGEGQEQSAAATCDSPPPQGKRERTCEWHRVPGLVTHTFTHFPLELAVFRARVPNRTRAPNGMRWIAATEIDGEAFPNVMRKVIAHAKLTSSVTVSRMPDIFPSKRERL